MFLPDDRPGVLGLRWLPKWITLRPNFKLVILDHGLYREIDPKLRSGYAALWRSLLNGNEAAIRKSAMDVAGVDMYPLFASMLTGGILIF
jgi:aarF domain-containing kinase